MSQCGSFVGGGMKIYH